MARTPYTGTGPGSTARVPYTGDASGAPMRVPYTGQDTTQAPPAHHGSLFGNFAHDVGSTVTGIVPAMVVAGEAAAHDLNQNLHGHPTGIAQGGGQFGKKVVDPIVKSEKTYYAPLAHGDLSGFYSNFHSHPLAAVTDALTLLGGGAARIAALREADGAAAVSKAALTGRTTGELKTITGRAAHGGAEIPLRTLPRNAGRAARMVATDKALRVATKVIAKPTSRTGEELPLIGEFARAARAARRDTLPVQLRHLGDTRYVNYLRAFSKLSKDERVAVGLLARVPLHADLHAWAGQVAEHGDDVSKRLAAQIARPGVMKAYDELPPKVLTAVEAARTLGKAREDILLHHGALTPDTAVQAPYRHMREVRGQEGTGAGGDATTTELRAELDAAGRPHPFYLPDVAVESKEPYLAGSAGGGLTPQRALADVRQSHLVLFRAGALMLHPDVLGPAYLRAAKHDFYTALHDKVKELAVPIPDGAGLPRGYEWVREKRGEKIPYLETNRQEHLGQVDEMFGTGHLSEAPTLTHTSDAGGIERGETGHRLAVSSAFAKEFAGEFQRASEFTRLVNKYPMRVWRALILNLRVPWLTNNILGNTFLYALRNAGPEGLRAFVGMVGQTKGGMAVRKLLNAPVTRDHLTAADIQEVFPEQAHGTFIGTNLPKFGKAGSAGRRFSQGLAPVDRASEGGLRRAATEAALRRDPKVRAIYQAMPKQTRSMRAAMVQAASGDEDLRRLVVREVNDTLGDYLRMSPHERGAIRNLIPFYAWFREITRIAAKITIDTPATADFLSKVGAVGAELGGGPWPSYLQGSVPVGQPKGDIQTLLALRSANPLTSATDVLSGKNPAGELNPFLGAAAKYLASGDAKNPANLYKLPGEVVKQVGAALPEVRVGTNPPSRLYPGRTRLDLLEQLLGDPRRKVSAQQAHYYESQGK